MNGMKVDDFEKLEELNNLTENSTEWWRNFNSNIRFKNHEQKRKWRSAWGNRVYNDEENDGVNQLEIQEGDFLNRVRWSNKKTSRRIVWSYLVKLKTWKQLIWAYTVSNIQISEHYASLLKMVAVSIAKHFFVEILWTHSLL